MSDPEDAGVGTRFWSKVEVTGFCWNWVAGLRAGYGKFNANGTTYRAHRLAYEFLVGPIPDGLELDHLCRNRACINPDHLEPVTHTENVARAALLLPRRVRCSRGHEYTKWDSRGWPICLRCHNDNRKAKRRAAKAAQLPIA